MTLERCREVDSSFSGRVTQEQFDQVCKISYLFIASSLWRRMEERGCRGCGSGQFFIRRRYLGDFSLISSAGCFLKVLANESQCRNLCFWGYRYCGICWFFFVVLRHLYSLLVVLQYSAPDSPPMTPLWREDECGKVVTNKFNGAIFAFVRFGEKERQVNKPECKL